MASQDKANFGRDRNRTLPGQKRGQMEQGTGSRQDDRSGGKSAQQSSGNFANDPSRVSEMGRKGGEKSGGDRH